jgi:hypothetical protein
MLTTITQQTGMGVYMKVVFKASIIGRLSSFVVPASRDGCYKEGKEKLSGDY